MAEINRRQFIQTSAAALAIAGFTHPLRAIYSKLKVGVTDWNLQHTAQSSSIEFARTIGFDGVQISLGRAPDPKNPPAHLPLGDPGLQSHCRTISRYR